MPVSAPLVHPTQNTGAQAQAALFASQGLDAFKKAAALCDPASPLGQAILHALKSVSKEVGSVPPETQANSLQSQLIEAKRNAMQRLVMQMQQKGGAGATAPGGASPGAVPAAAPLPPSPALPMAA